MPIQAQLKQALTNRWDGCCLLQPRRRVQHLIWGSELMVIQTVVGLEGELCFSKRLSWCISPSFWREIITVKSDAKCALILVNSYSSKTWAFISNLPRLPTRKKKNLSSAVFKMCQVSSSNSRNAESLISKAANLWALLQSHIPCMTCQGWEMTAALSRLAHKRSVTFFFLSNRVSLLLPWSAFPRSLKGGVTH